MNNLRFLRFDSDTLCTPEGLDCLPDKLRLLHWNGCPLEVWPSKFSGKFLVELSMRASIFEMLWEGIKPLRCLKMLQLSSSLNLKKIPDLSEATSLEELHLQDCKSLLELTSSIGNATKLYRLDISRCTKIKDFPNVSDSIVELDLSETGIKEVPPWIENLFRLRKLFMCGCKQLNAISPNISKLENLEFLCLSKLSRVLHEHEDKDSDEIYYNENYLFEAIIEWGPEFKRSWRLRTDFKVHYILPICLPKKALTSPTSLRLRNMIGIKTIPDCIRRLSGLVKLDVKECLHIVAIPPLPDSLLSLDAQGCIFLNRIDSSFPNPNICLNFADCYMLEQKARKLIQTSACKYAVLRGGEVPAHFTHRASSGSLTINLTPRPLPSSLRFKACILLSKVYNHPGDNSDDDDDDDDEGIYSLNRNSLNRMSYSVRGKQSGLTVGGGSNQFHMPAIYGCIKHLYIFEDSFSLNKDCPEAEETTFSELTFVFRVHNKTYKVEGCGVRLLEANNQSEGVVEDEEKDDYYDYDYCDYDDDDDDDDDDDGGEGDRW